MPKSSSTKTYVLELKNGSQRKLTVPADWRVTFGPTVPFERKSGGGFGNGGDGIWALRLYEAKDKLRAIFTDVRAFRDTDIKLMEKRTRVKRQVLEKESRKGGKQVVAEARIEEWADPDAPDTDVPSEYLSLEHHSGDSEL